MDLLIQSVIGILTIIASAYVTQNTNKKTIKANIQSKTNIEWIDQIRKLSAELIYSYELIVSSSKISYAYKVEIIANQKKIKNEIDQAWNSGVMNTTAQNQNELFIKNKRNYDEKYNEYVSKASLLTNQLLLYFIDDKKDNHIVELITSLRLMNTRIADFSREPIEAGRDLDYYHNLTEKQLELSNEFTIIINDFRSEVTSHLKSEWENVKSGK